MTFRLVVTLSVYDSDARDSRDELVCITAQKLREYAHEENARADAIKVREMMENLYKIMSGVD